MDYAKKKELEDPEKMSKITGEMTTLKEKIIQMNANLSVELEGFERDRLDKFRRILSCKCYSEKQKAEIIAKFVSIESKMFPYKDSSNLKLKNNDTDSDN
eukprot:TRINITY_DN13415_c0_g1_i7.p1 TRINITY_DN13415_c0_g1~~TRINITY_DN13415_c0_g1_i7.p1  ORF type:complete len:100 (+),score=36.62 TRINITY_DN13415_c0_g1_i7:1469-1768(+)